MVDLNTDGFSSLEGVKGIDESPNGSMAWKFDLTGFAFLSTKIPFAFFVDPSFSLFTYSSRWWDICADDEVEDEFDGGMTGHVTGTTWIKMRDEYMCIRSSVVGLVSRCCLFDKVPPSQSSGRRSLCCHERGSVSLKKAYLRSQFWAAWSTAWKQYGRMIPRYLSHLCLYSCHCCFVNKSAYLKSTKLHTD